MRKRSNILLCILLIVVFAISPIMLDMAETINWAEREISVDQINEMTYEDEVQKMLSVFDSYNSYLDVSGNYVFDAEIKDSLLDNLEFLSTENLESVTKKYSAKLDQETELFYVTISYYQNTILLSSDTIESEPYYNEFEDEYYIVFDDETTIRVSDIIFEESFDECSTLVLTAGAAAITAVAGLLVIYAVTQDPEISKTVNTIVTTVVTTVVSWVRSFARWFKRLWKKVTKTETKTVTEQVITEDIKYKVDLKVGSLTLNVELSSYDKLSSELMEGYYYLAIADTYDGKLYVSTQAVDDVLAKSILLSDGGIWISSAHKECKDSKYILSIYTYEQSLALSIATEAAVLSGNSAPYLHVAKVGSKYFDHYHHTIVGEKESSPHTFFGSPK